MDNCEYLWKRLGSCNSISLLQYLANQPGISIIHCRNSCWTSLSCPNFLLYPELIEQIWTWAQHSSCKASGHWLQGRGCTNFLLMDSGRVLELPCSPYHNGLLHLLGEYECHWESRVANLVVLHFNLMLRMRGTRTLGILGCYYCSVLIWSKYSNMVVIMMVCNLTRAAPELLTMSNCPFPCFLQHPAHDSALIITLINPCTCSYELNLW